MKGLYLFTSISLCFAFNGCDIDVKKEVSSCPGKTM
jgi:hypothetical protein